MADMWSNEFVCKRELARLLMEKSYREGDFTLSSGRKSDYYFDCRVTALSAKGAYLIGDMFNHLLKDEDIKGVAGMSLGADPLVTSVSIMSRARQRGVLDALYVRKEPKDHGMGRQVEGVENFRDGDKIAVLDDVATSGGSILKVCSILEKLNFRIVKCCVILDREEGARAAIESAGYPFVSIFTRKNLLEFGR